MSRGKGKDQLETMIQLIGTTYSSFLIQLLTTYTKYLLYTPPPAGAYKLYVPRLEQINSIKED